MSEIGEVFKAMHEHNRAERWEHSRHNRLALAERGIQYDYHADTGTVLVDGFQFWTTTGKWYNAKTKQRGHGVNELIKLLEASK